MTPTPTLPLLLLLVLLVYLLDHSMRNDFVYTPNLDLSSSTSSSSAERDAAVELVSRERLLEPASLESLRTHFLSRTSRERKDELVRHYVKFGFVVIPDAVPRAWNRAMLRLAKLQLTHWWWRRHFTVGEISLAHFLSFRRNPLIRAYYANHPLNSFAARLLGDEKSEVNENTPLRLLTDIIAGVSKGRAGFKWHSDRGSFNVVENDSPATSIWCPMWEDDGEGSMMVELNETTGGLVALANLTSFQSNGREDGGDPCSYEAQRARGSVFTPSECAAEYERRAFKPRMRNGDCLLFSKEILHRSEPIVTDSPISERYVMNARYIRGDALGVPNRGAKDLGLVLPHVACLLSVGDEEGRFNMRTGCTPIIHPPSPQQEEEEEMRRATFDNLAQLSPLVRLHGWRVLMDGMEEVLSFVVGGVF